MFRLLFLLGLMAGKIFASDLPMFYWDNQMGFVDANHCELSYLDKQSFRISQYFGKDNLQTEFLRNHNGTSQSNLINGSLVKITPTKLALKDYEFIEVAGVNQNPLVPTNKYMSERADQGYLYYRSLLPTEDYVIQIKRGAPSSDMGNLANSAVNTYWKLAMKSNYIKMNCKENNKNRDYVVFRVYKAHQNEPFALVGVYFDETRIFKSIRTYSKYDIIATLPNILTETPIENVGVVDTDTDDNSTPVMDDSDLPVGPIDSDDSPVIGSLEDVICTQNKTLNVRDESLDLVLFSAKRGEKIKVFQTFGSVISKKKVINNKTYTFVKVEFPEREENDQVTGWIAASYIKPRSKCDSLPAVEDDILGDDTQVSGLDDPNCCKFPTVEKVTHRFNEGMRRFKAGRSGGKRLHAACDLYRYQDEPIMSVAPGKVIRPIYYFYQGTYALEVVHSGGFVVRYGEITGNLPSGIAQGKEVNKGQRIAYMGKVNSNCCRPMLHFELYSGEGSGALSVSGNGFNRRSDLMDPTDYLLKWEKANFED